MKITDVAAIVTGGASGLGEAVVRAIISRGGRAAILDLDDGKGNKLANELGGAALYCKTDVSSESDVTAAVEAAASKFGSINAAVNSAGIATAGRTISKKGPADLKLFELAITVNLIGTFNVIRLAAMKMSENSPNSEGERGVIVNTASVAAFDGQIGQAGYAASKSGVVGMTLPIARDLSSYGIRNVTIAPGIFDTPMMASFTDEVRASLAQSVPFPQRLGRPEEFAAMVLHVMENSMLNGETIRLDGALRMAPK
ncbi:MAG TPA: 3-hydroxyacyl-CoA dehydrogenase [Spirochaetota bacterium]|nr:3-hydroxyacyl-CoA dehydrogenase [Spirochaetota bacterium]HPC40479.1 3-hydroxyacyl-CoA dehydrogenase [Spirochaetota bacterium]HQF06546.1 3-hydroxyacyl-CoA dehydrogenase [Spirochaetota bacterium]HQH96051.1 3-hydroxyacyl-CoA dehydrogenase [Spirochaetota bacterium]